MSVEEKLYVVLNDYEERHTIWREEEVNNEWEYYEIDDDLMKIFNEENIENAHIEHTEMFENPGIITYSVSIAWIEKGELCSILNYQIDCI